MVSLKRKPFRGTTRPASFVVWTTSKLPGFASISFEEAIWEAGEFRLIDAGWHDEKRGIQVSSSVITSQLDGVLNADELTLECLCDGVSPWVIRGREVTWLPDEELLVRGGRIGLLGKAFLPLPNVRLPLGRRSGFLIPEVGVGIDGYRFKAPLYLTLGPSADVTLTPELRTQRSLRLLSESRIALRHGSVHANLDGGYDWSLQQTRGAARWDVNWFHRRLNVATTGQMLGDANYLKDYGDRYLTRQTPWTESRGLVGFGHLELSSSLIQSAASTKQELGMLNARLPATEGPAGVLIDGGLEAAFIGSGSDPWMLTESAYSGRARFGLERPMIAGPLLIRPRLAGAVVSDRATTDFTGYGEVDVRALGCR